MDSIKDLKEGLNVKGLECYVGDISDRETKKGKPFITVMFKDSTGEISGNIWDTSSEDWTFKREDVIAIYGTVGAFGGNLQFNYKSADRLDKPIEDFFRCSEFNIDKMFEHLTDGYLEKIKDPFIKFIAEELILSKPFVDMFCKAPAAKGVHHNWIGGLLEHALGLCNMATELYQGHYKKYLPTLNMDKVYFGCMFHDWGKILEYGYNTPNICYTKRGSLQHHMGIVAEAITRMAVRYEDKIDDPKELVRYRTVLHELLHIIYSHHGKVEWGSMVVPATAEALFVHQLDYMDSQLMHMRGQIIDRKQGDIEGMSPKSFIHGTGYLLLPEEEGF